MDNRYASAEKIYKYYYNLAIKEFDPITANILAKIPADFVYNNYGNCSQVCCLKYCNDMLDSEFNKLSPEEKRIVYDKSFNVQSSVSPSEINLSLKSKRRKFKNLYYNAARKYKTEQENDLSKLMGNLSVKRKHLDDILGELNLNKH